MDTAEACPGRKRRVGRERSSRHRLGVRNAPILGQDGGRILHCQFSPDPAKFRSVKRHSTAGIIDSSAREQQRYHVKVLQRSVIRREIPDPRRS